MKLSKKMIFSLFSAVGLSTTQGAVLISDTVGNGSLVTTFGGNNTTLSGGGWTASRGVFTVTTDSTLTSLPFGAQSSLTTTHIQIHNNAGEDFRSTAVSLTAGEIINFSVDTIGNGRVDVDLFDGVNSIFLGRLENINASVWEQSDFNGATVTTTGNYQLRFRNDAGSDLQIDRVFLQSVPEPSSTIFLALGSVCLMYRKRK